MVKYLIEKHYCDPIDHELVTKVYCMFTGSDNGVEMLIRALDME